MDDVIRVAGKVCCPNHGYPLEGIGTKMPRKGEGICPVSGAHFAFEADTDESKIKMVQDKDGKIFNQAGWKITGND